MAGFFVKTEHSAAGPFTGVELREAALSGIIGPHSLVGDTDTGPWHPAMAIGLFSEKRIALPHPEGTVVPRYHVRGMIGSAQGPFKLRELIGFAARGMLAADVEIQSDVTQTWIPVNRIHVLRACLKGDLVLLGSAGEIQRRTDLASPHFVGTPASVVSPSAAAVVPETVARSAQHHSDVRFGSPEHRFDNQPLGSTDAVDTSPADSAYAAAETWPVSQTDAADDNSDHNNSDRERFPLRLRKRIGRCATLVREWPRSPVALRSIAVLFVIAAIGIFQSQYQTAGMAPDRVMGDWIEASAEGQSSQPASFAISFRDDGRCVIFSPYGRSWTGDFSWTDRQSDAPEFSSPHAIEANFDAIAPNHLHSPVQPTDGHVRFQGMMSSPPEIAGRLLRDCFLRRDGDSLLLGYLSSVRWSKGQKSMQAGWIRLQPLSHPTTPRVAEKLKSIPSEPRPADVMRSSEPDFPIADAIVSIDKGPAGKRGPRFASPHGRLTYSSLVDADYLLRTFGIPDAARPLFPFEAPRLRPGPSFETSQLIRYGELKFLMNREGHLQYVSRMQ
ncbi:hypothetical protein RMSM_05146 [Rhodopirellula maiorica SM1]|uniref:GYF domain-containing protein n=1 Tax=Rhodopirellula maiorica SM1 TaxID=1265738 RepID=M5RFR1_9BACT|nr:hypothetical protein [Rhodopirellula maiorica]EMI17931.1 hypothetical protein RMSM_05146 [Rhodopirellula maiorica SM1]